MNASFPHLTINHQLSTIDYQLFPMPKKSPIIRASSYEAAKKATGLSEPKLALLLDLMENGGSSYASIVERTGVNGKTLLRYVRDLRLSAHIARGTGKEEFSTAVFSLTNMGEKLVKGLLAHLEK